MLITVHAQTEKGHLHKNYKIYIPSKDQNRFETHSIRQKMQAYDVLHYDINLTLDPELQTLQGVTHLSFTSKIDIEQSIPFDFAGLQLDSVLLQAQKVDFTREKEVILIDSPLPIPSDDTIQVSFYYRGQPVRGMYFRNNYNGQKIIYTHNEPYDAHFWFPCKDDPGDKATLAMNVTVPEPMEVLSNGKLGGKTLTGTEQLIFSWHENYPIATYLISITAGPYAVVRNEFAWGAGTLPLAYWVYPSNQDRGVQALSWTKEMLAFFSEFIGEYPFLLEKYDMAEAPLREAAAMENQTATTMGDFVMDDEGVIAHELAHQWWGDALTPHSFEDIWLNEGFASYFDALFTENKYGKEAFRQQMESYKSRLIGDGSIDFPILNPPEEYLFGNAVYMKGAWVLHMLRQITGDDVFKYIFREYYEVHRYSNVRTGDFIRIAEQIEGQSLTAFFDQWLNYGGMPVIIGNWHQQRNQLTIILEQFQDSPLYQMNVEVQINGISADSVINIPLRQKITRYELNFPETVTGVVIDPEEKILNINNSPLYYIPKVSKILKIFPNPSRDEVNIVYQAGKNAQIEIIIFNLLGQTVSKIINEKQAIGVYQVSWPGRDFGSGIYFCLMKTGDTRDKRKIVVLK